MDKLILLKQISKIHAEKCNRATQFKVAEESFSQLDLLKGLVVNAQDDLTLKNIIEKISE